MRAPTERFSTRVENYVKYRPGYPPAIVPLLETACGFTAESVVADIGSGTGILAEVWLKHGNPVFAVEPNGPMRAAAERLLAGYPAFTSMNGTAEATTLSDQSVDFVTAGQAFHWFDPAAARQEFGRILRPGGWVALVWNVRRPASTPFLAGYEALLSAYAPEYPGLTREWEGRAGTETLFGPGRFETALFENHQLLDLAGVQGRLLSSSYAPEPGTPAHAPMMAALAELFAAHAVDGQVAFEYDTEVYYGRLGGA